MAYCREENRRLTGRTLIAGLVACAVVAVAAHAAAAVTRPKSHFLSWESLNRPQEVRRYQQTHGELRRFKVSKDRIGKLKKSSFWNKRPYQFASPIVADDVVYVGCDAGHFYAIQERNEKKLWDFVADGPIQAKAALADGTVYVGDTKANVYALDAATGKELWRARVDSEILAQPLVSGSRLVVTDLSGRLYALDRATGSPVWHTPPADRGIGFSVRRASSPVEAGGLIFAGTSSGNVIAYRAGDGSVAWVRQLGDRQNQVYDIDGAPLVSGNRVFVSATDGSVAALDAGSGEVLWTAEGGGPNDLLLHEGRLYATGNGILTALDPMTGAIAWQQNFETPEISSAAGGEHYVAVVSTVDKLYLVDSGTGDIVFDRFIRKGSFGDPAVEGPYLFILSNPGALYGFRIRELPPKKVRVAKEKKDKKAPAGDAAATEQPAGN